MELRINEFVLEDGHLLREYNPKDNDLIQVIDHDPDSPAINGWLDDVTLVEKYEMPDEVYDKLPNTYRAWKRKKLEEDPNWLPPWIRKQVDEVISKRLEEGVESLEDIEARYKVGNRCECKPGARRGEIKYIGYANGQGLVDSAGKIHMPQVWIGVQFDEPVGKNDGSAKGKRFFTCGKNYGAFLKPHLVQVGDFPEKDPFASDDDEEEETNNTSLHVDDSLEDLMEEL